MVQVYVFDFRFDKLFLTKLKRFLFLTFSFISFSIIAQPKQSFSRYEYLHGKLTSLRSCFDVKQYEITVKVEPNLKYISGKNVITFFVVNDFQQFQLDLFLQMKIDSIVFENKQLVYKRDSNAVFVNIGKKIRKGELHNLTVYFRGYPPIAKNAPWDGGFVWSKDSSGSDWVGLACEGLGASCWLPCKDHLSDEADSMKMHLIVPENLVGVSNGKLVSQGNALLGFKQFDWEVHNPINNYNITINVANYAHIHDEYESKVNAMQKYLPLDYYVLKENEEKARMFFPNEVKRMLDCFELRFGAYPFWSDGYKLVETPYWGMEHQSCVSYGNGYKGNRWGFDFIIVHESGHEWFGNSLSCKDAAEMWIHESFTTYSETLFLECQFGYQTSLKYLIEQRRNIQNNVPMIGPYDVNFHGRKDNDIYYKGAWVLQTLRSVIDHDSVWFLMLKELNNVFGKKNITTANIVQLFNEKSNLKLEKFFEQYLTHAAIPELEYKIVDKGESLELHYRWSNTIHGFEMPIKATISKGLYDFILPTRNWQIIDLNFLDQNDFKIQTDKFLINVKKL